MLLSLDAMTHPVTVDTGDGKPLSQHRHDLGVGDLPKQVVDGAKEISDLLSAGSPMRGNPSSETFTLHNAVFEAQHFPTLDIGHGPQEPDFLISEVDVASHKPREAKTLSDLPDSFAAQTILRGDLGIKHGAHLFYEAGVAVLHSLYPSLLPLQGSFFLGEFRGGDIERIGSVGAGATVVAEGLTPLTLIPAISLDRLFLLTAGEAVVPGFPAVGAFGTGPEGGLRARSDVVTVEATLRASGRLARHVPFHRQRLKQKKT